jgi:chromosome condensin MukBEF MukE localization factor
MFYLLTPQSTVMLEKLIMTDLDMNILPFCKILCAITQSLYLPTDAQESCFKRMLKFTLKQLLHVSVQSPSSGSALFELAKVIVIKIIC